MQVTDSMQLANWVCQLNFFRVCPGSDKEARASLENGTQAGDSSRHYKCFGHYDLVQISYKGQPSSARMYGSPYILQSVSLPLFPWSNNLITKQTIGWLDNAPLVLLVLFKLHPIVIRDLGLKGELAALHYLASRLGQDRTSIFTSLGHNEVVAIIKGNNFRDLLSCVAKIRDHASIGDVFGSGSMGFGSINNKDMPAFVNTTSFPLVSYELVLDTGNYQLLQGNVRPVLMIRCQPGSDKALIAGLPTGDKVAFECFGKEDILVMYSDEVALADFTKQIVTLRESWRDHPGLCDTSTYLLGGYETAEEQKPTLHPEVRLSMPDECAHAIGSLSFALESDWLGKDTKVQLEQFLNRFANCAADVYVSAEYADMLGFLHFLETLLRRIESQFAVHHHQEAQIEKDVLSGLLNLANNALHQRYAGIEAHLEGVPSPLFTATEGVNRVILAAGEIPMYVLNEVLVNERNGELWPGFVMFSEIYSYQAFQGDILSYPIRALLDPLGSWTTITHEISHFAFVLLNFKGHILDALEKMTEGLRKHPAYPRAGFLQIVWELFAHWYDFRYFYGGEDIHYFIKDLWRGWLQVPTVWVKKKEYLVRSLLMYLYSEREELAAKATSKSKYKLYIKSRFTQMMGYLIDEIREMPSFMNEVKPKDIRATIIDAFYFSGIFEIFESRFFNEHIYNQLNSGYSDLQKHIRLLENGEVITGEIENPKALLFSLVKKLRGQGTLSPMNTQVAIILSFANDYRRRQRLAQEQ